MAAQSLGIYLMAIYDGPWVDDSRADAEKTPAMIAGEEREELLQLRQEKAQMEADREELLKLRLESQNRKTVLSELERLRQELEDERNGRQEDQMCIRDSADTGQPSDACGFPAELR